jgi:hypothetical protein
LIPDTWLAWYIFHWGVHPVKFRFVGVLRTGTSDMALFEMENGTQVSLPEKILAYLVPTEAPHIVRPEPCNLEANKRCADGGQLAPAELNAKVMRTAMGMYSNRSI